MCGCENVGGIIARGGQQTDPRTHQARSPWVRLATDLVWMTINHVHASKIQDSRQLTAHARWTDICLCLVFAYHSRLICHQKFHSLTTDVSSAYYRPMRDTSIDHDPHPDFPLVFDNTVWLEGQKIHDLTASETQQGAACRSWAIGGIHHDCAGPPCAICLLYKTWMRELSLSKRHSV